MPSSRGSSQPRNRTQFSYIAGEFFTVWATRCLPLIIPQFSSVKSFSRVRLFVTPWTAARQTSLSITNTQSLPKPMSIESVMPSNHLILCRHLLLLPSIFPSIRVFSNESALRISPSNEHPGLISFKIDWFDPLAVRGTLETLFRHHSWKAPILWRSAFSVVHLSHLYMTTGKTIALTI